MAGCGCNHGTSPHLVRLHEAVMQLWFAPVAIEAPSRHRRAWAKSGSRPGHPRLARGDEVTALRPAAETSRPPALLRSCAEYALLASWEECGAQSRRLIMS